MKKPVFSWESTLSALGYRVIWKPRCRNYGSVATVQKPIRRLLRRSRELTAPSDYQTLEPRQMLAPLVTAWQRNGVNIDLPTLLSRPDQLNTVAVTFDQDVTVTKESLRVFNDRAAAQVGSYQPVSINAAIFSYNSVAHTATWDLSGISATLQPADYTLTLNYASIKNSANQYLVLNGALSKQVYKAIPGDANLDRDVDISQFSFPNNVGDLVVVKANLGTVTDATWNRGDFNGDGDVDVSQFSIPVGNVGDLTTLYANLGISFPAAAKTNGVAPLLNAITNQQATAGQSLAIAGSFSDVDPVALEGFVVELNWGDGTVEYQPVANGSFSFNAVHTFQATGTFNPLFKLIDSFGNTFSRTFQVGVAASGNVGTTFSILETATVGTVLGSVPDFGPNSIYKILKGNNGQTFAVNPATGLMTIADNDLLDARTGSFVVLVEVTSFTGAKKIEQIRVEIEDVDTAPIFVTPDILRVFTSARNQTVIGSVAAVDPEDQAIIYSLSPTSSIFGIKPTTGEIFVLNASALLAGGAQDYTLNLVATDPTNHSAMTILTIKALDQPNAVVTTGVQSFSTSHRRDLNFISPTGYENYVTAGATAAPYFVRFFTSGGNFDRTPGQSLTSGLDFGSIKVSSNPFADSNNDDIVDGVLIYDPDNDLLTRTTTSSKPMLTAQTSATGDYRYAGTEGLISYEVWTTGPNGSKLDAGSFSITVTNELPIFRSDLVHKSAGYNNSPPVNRSKTDVDLRMYANERYRFDLNDYFYDPDGDPLVISSVNDYGDSSSDPTQLVIKFGDENVNGSSTKFPKYVTAEKVGSDLLDFLHNGRRPGFNRTFTATFTVREFGVSFSDGQLNSTGNPVNSNFAATVRPISDVRPAQATEKWPSDVTVIKDTDSYLFDNGINPMIRVDAFSRESSRTADSTSSVGNALVDVNSGNVQINHGLSIDGSGGSSEFPLPGLVYDSSMVDPRPVIQAKIRLDSSLTLPTGVTATLRWIDHVTDYGAATAYLSTKSYNLSLLSQPNGNEFLISIQPDAAAPMTYSGIYHWELELDLTYNDFGNDVHVMVDSRGQSIVEVQRRVTPSDFDFSSITRNSQPLFGNGWSLLGVPELIVDQYQERMQNPLFAATSASTTSTLTFNRERLIVFFPGSAPRVFRPEFDGLQTFDFDPFDFVPVPEGTEFVAPNEWGTLSGEGSEIIYTAGDHTRYVFKEFDNDPNDEIASQWLIIRIKAPGTPAVLFVRHATTGQLDSIIGTDGRTTVLQYGSDGFLDRFIMPGNRFVEFEVTGDQLRSIKHLNVIQSSTGGVNIPNRIRQFTYDADSRVQTDAWRNESVSQSQRLDSFQWDTFGLIEKIVVGRNVHNGADTNPDIEQLFTPIASVGLRSMTTSTPSSPNHLWRLDEAFATLEISRQDLEKWNELTQSGTAMNGNSITQYGLDRNGSMVSRESFFGSSTAGGTKTSLNRESWTYDHLGSTLTHIDPLQRQTRYQYDYQQGAASEFETPGQAAGVPIYDVNDFRGNVVRMDSFVGTEIFEFETRDAQAAALGGLVKSTDFLGAVSQWTLDTAGRTTKLERFRSGNTSYVEQWTYDAADLLSSHTDPLGLVENYTYTLNRQLDTRKFTDAGSIGDNNGESKFYQYVYDPRGFVDSIAQYSGTSTSGIHIGTTDLDYDATGYLIDARTLAATLSGGAILTFVRYEYAADGLVSLTLDGNAVGTLFEFDRRGLLVKTTEAQSKSYTAHFNTLNRSVQQETKYEYYSDGSLKKTILPDHTAATGDNETVRRFVDPVARSQWTVQSGIAKLTDIGAGGTVTPTFISQVVRQTVDVQGRVTSFADLLTGAESEFIYRDLRNDQRTLEIQKLNLDGMGEISVIQHASLYNARGELIRSRVGNRAPMRYRYDELGYLTASKTDVLGGGEFEYQTDAVGNVTQVQEFRQYNFAGAGLFEANHRFDQQGRLRRTVDPERANETLAVDAAIDYVTGSASGQYRVSSTTRDGLVTEQFLDAAGQVVRSVNAYGGQTRFQYDTADNLIHQYVDANLADSMPSRHTEFKYDALNRVRETIEGTSLNNWLHTYNDYFLVGDLSGVAGGFFNWDMVSTDARNQVSMTMVDTAGNPIVSVLPDPDTSVNGDQPIQIFSYDYNPTRKLVATTARTTVVSAAGIADKNYVATRIERSVANTAEHVLLTARRETFRNLSDAVTASNYVDSGYIVDQRAIFGFDGRVKSSFNGRGQETKYVYNHTGPGTGQLVYLTLPDGGVVRYDYDSAGNQRNTVDAAGNVTMRSYDGLSRMTGESTTVDTFDSVTGVVNGSTAVARQWNFNGLTTTYTDRNGRVTTTSLNPNRNVGEAPATINTSASYGDTSYLSSQYLNSDGSSQQASDQWTGGIQSGNSSTIGWSYDALGRLVQNMQSFTVDGRSVSATRAIGLYHATGQVAQSQWTVGDSIVSNEYGVDGLGRYNHVQHSVFTGSNTSVVAADLQYNALGQRTRLDRKQDVTVSSSVAAAISNYVYDGLGRLTDLTHFQSNEATPISHYQLVFDLASQPVSTQVQLYLANGTNAHDELRRQKFDSTGRVTSVGAPDAAGAVKWVDTQQYQYDKNGNRNNGSGEVIGKSNRLVQDANFRYAYDKEGNLIHRYARSAAFSDTIFAWDHRNVLISTTENGITHKFGNDALGRQVSSDLATNAGVVLGKFYGTSSNPEVLVNLAAASANNPLHQVYLTAPDNGETISVWQSNSETAEPADTYWTLADTIGTVRTLHDLDGSTNRIQHRNFDAFGNRELFTQRNSAGAIVGLQQFTLGDGQFDLNDVPSIYSGQLADSVLPDSFRMGNRIYDGAAGRFVTDGGGENGYVFAANDPFQGLTGSTLNASTWSSITTSASNWWNNTGTVDPTSFGYGYRHYLFNPSEMDNGTRHIFYGATAVAAAAGTLASGGLLNGLSTAGTFATGTVTSLAHGIGIGGLFGGGISAFRGESVTTGALLGMGGGALGGLAGSGFSGGSRFYTAVGAGGVGGAAEGGFRAALTNGSWQSVVQGAVVDGAIGAVTGGLLDRALWAGGKVPIASAPNGVGKWNIWDNWNPKIRGRAIENLWGRNLPKDFPGIDMFDDGLATSIKSINLKDVSYQTASQLRSTLKKYLNKLSEFNGATFDGVTIRASQITGKELKIAIPPSISYRPTKAQLDVLDELKQLAAEKRIRIIVEEVLG